ncbi:MAG TPA: hypothetical protein VN697_13915 [Tepidiformaceae bacterium]|nr:hypothetical protein [Tepidiformaceae bacterium]
MLYDAIFISLYVVGWLVCAFVPWLVLSVVSRGHAGLIYLPLCLFVGVVAGFAVPIFGLTDALGLWLSFAAAFVAPALLLGVRRFSLGGVDHSALSSTMVAPPLPGATSNEEPDIE